MMDKKNFCHIFSQLRMTFDSAEELVECEQQMQIYCTFSMIHTYYMY